jgi:hypothetical protein
MGGRTGQATEMVGVADVRTVGRTNQSRLMGSATVRVPAGSVGRLGCTRRRGTRLARMVGDTVGPMMRALHGARDAAFGGRRAPGRQVLTVKLQGLCRAVRFPT